MKSLTLALTCLCALVWSSAAWATNTASVTVECDNEGRPLAFAIFSYTSGANGRTADETVSLDGTVQQRGTFDHDSGTSSHTRFVRFPSDGQPHTISATTVVRDSQAQDSASATCSHTKPPPPPPFCETHPDADRCNDEPPPFCETHPNADICDDPPPRPCEGAECDELPHTGASWALPLGIVGAFLAIVGTFLALSRRRQES